jgi:hypothetical protein
MPTTTPNFGWSVPVSTDLVKDGATAIELLGDSIDASLVDLKGGTTGQVLAKASGTDMDFSWVAQDDSNAIQNAIVDAKGDLISATAADTPARLAVGTNGQILTADSTTATGLKWATAATASSGLTFITRSTISNVASADLDNIFTSTYETYKIVIETAYGANTSDDLAVQLRYAGPATQSADYYGRVANLNAGYSNNAIDAATSAILISNIRNSADQASNATFVINNVGNGSRNPMGYTIGWSANDLGPNVSSFYQATARVYTGLRFLTSAGNLTANISVYGLAKS